MIRSELFGTIAEKTRHLTDADVALAVRTIIDGMAEHLASGERIEIRGFGSFSVKKRYARIGRNPKSGETVPVPEKQILHFKAGRELRERVDKRST